MLSSKIMKNKIEEEKIEFEKLREAESGDKAQSNGQTPPEEKREGGQVTYEKRKEDKQVNAKKKDDEQKIIEISGEKMTKKDSFIELLKFVGFSISAGVIQLLSFELLYNWINWHVWWPCYLISIILSVVWNFTFNRKFTFKSASNVPFAMFLVTIYYCAFIPLSVFGGGALENIGWNGTLVTVLMMLINFTTEFLWDKFVVFNDKLTNKILKRHKKNDGQE